MPSKILPNKTELRHMLDSGMTHRQIAETLSRQMGRPVARATVSAAIYRAGLSGAPKRKYTEELPWPIKEIHQTHYAARMLRLLGRRRAGIRNSEEMDSRLEAWLRQLKDEAVVVTYVPETEPGFFYVPGQPTADGIPILEDYREVIGGKN